MSRQTDKVLRVVREAGVLRPRDLDPYGIPRSYLTRLARAGKVLRVGRGLYTLPDAVPTEHRALAEAAKRVPASVMPSVGAALP